MTILMEPIRVLVVDCNADAAENVATLLGAQGFAARVECKKNSALEAARVFRPHAVLIDLGPDNLNTYELAAALRRLPGLTDVFLITMTDGMLPISERMKDLQIDVRLTKPAGYRMLISTLKHQFMT